MPSPLPPAKNRFKPGQSGNPSGKGGEKRIILIHKLREIAAETRSDGKTNAEAIVRKIIEQAIKGKPWAVELFFERLDGKVPIGMEIDYKSRLPEKTDAELAAALLNAGTQTPDDPA